MARFLLTTIPAIGHVNPVLPIARQLVERGNEVCWYTGFGFQSQVEATGARIEQFIPYYHLLPHVDVMVTNGGYGGIQAALAHGIPLVTAGETEDKTEVSARVQWAGVGINLKTKTSTPKQLKDAVKTILTSSHYRQKAQYFQAEIARYNAPTNAAILLEKLAATKQPILRVAPA
ncbi:glycosyltransferase, MGT family protein [Calothrix sp. NIES-4071]|nr:glycosyltransferase, MGT family protein [Calothrix sp. NIES-4071]BAZ58691.1 glycosyltransferase, MGT family protein [Calothrix sp. NIES-4105]